MEADEAGNDGEAQRDERSGSGGSPVTAYLRYGRTIEGGFQRSPFDFCKRLRLLYIPGESQLRVLGEFQLLPSRPSTARNISEKNPSNLTAGVVQPSIEPNTDSRPN
jgi:hypothetical protein